LPTSAGIDGERNPGLTITIIKKMLEALGSEAEKGIAYFIPGHP
jgi:hypothetical protein